MTNNLYNYINIVINGQFGKTYIFDFFLFYYDLRLIYQLIDFNKS